MVLAVLRRALPSLALVLVPVCVAPATAPAATVGSTMTFPSGVGKPVGIAAGADGNLWYTGSDSDQIGRMTPAGAATQFALPAGSVPLEITAGPDGRLWFGNSQTSKIGRMTTAGSLTELPLPGMAAAAKGITTGPDGNLWFTKTDFDGAKVDRLTPSGTLTEFAVPTDTAAPIAITAGADGNLWFTENGANAIGRITPAGVVTEFPLPTGNANVFWVTRGPDGNVWFTEPRANKIGRITPAGVITEFSIPTNNSWPVGITAAPDGNLWFAEYFGSKVGRITPAGAIKEFPVPNAPRGLVAGPGDALWITDPIANSITKLFVGVPVPSLARSTVDFGNVRTDAPATEAVTLTNAGTGELVLGAIGLTGPDAAAFTVTAATTCAAGGVLTPGAACDVVLRHAPTAPGSATATLTIADALGRRTVAVSATAVDPPPGATTGAVTDVGTDAATVAGLADPLGAATTAHFEYGTTTGYGLSTDAQDVGAGTGPIPLSARLAGLSPATTYHVRLVATSARGTTTGADVAFTTAAVPVPAPPLAPGVPAPVLDPVAPAPQARPRVAPPTLALLSPSRLAVGRTGAVALRVRCASAAADPCQGTVALRLRGAALGRAVAFRTTARRPVATVRIRLSAAARAHIPRSARGARVTVVLRATDAAGRAARATATRTLRRR
jgi:streptogramin lyase